VRARVRLCNPRDESMCDELELLVDTGSTYTWIKREKLTRLSVKGTGRRLFRTIGNRAIEREVGEAVVECLGRRATTTVVFAEERDNEVLGLHALEGLGLEVDPVTGKLRESESILALTTFKARYSRNHRSC
jgi:predicted aspartyl protease